MKQSLKQINLIFLLTLFVLGQGLFLLPIESQAIGPVGGINERINYQGKLTNTSGVAVADGDYRMYFRLYNTESGGTAIWEEDRSTDNGDWITITNGLFSVMLGSSTVLSGVNFNQTLYLGVEICGLGSGVENCDGEMTPRKMIGAVPAAFESKKLNGLESWQFFRTDTTNSTSTASAYLRVTQSGAGNIASFVGQSSASVLTLLSNNKVAVGTSTPYARFSVWGGGTGTGMLASFVNNASTSVFNILDNGQIGVGTTSPYAKLSVAGQTVAEYFTATSTTATSTLPFLAVTGGLSTALTANSVAFIGAGGMLNQDNSNFTYVPSTGLTVQGGLTISSTSDTYSHFGNSINTNVFSPSDTNDRLVVGKDFSGTSGTVRAIGASARFTGSSDHSGSVNSIYALSRHAGAGALTASTGSGGISGGRIGVDFANTSIGATTLATGLSIFNNRSGLAVQALTLTEITGLQIEGGVFGTTSWTDYNGIRIKEPSGAGGTKTNIYGLRIDEMDYATNNWAIYTSGSTKSYFGGKVGIGTTTPYSKLTVWGSGTGSAKIFELVNNASTTVFSVAENGTTNIGSAAAGNIVFDTSTSGDIVLVGIGTTTPDADVSIVSDQASNNTYIFTVATTTGNTVNRRFTIDSDGDIAYDGTASTPADYAEAFTVVGSKGNYEPGDIIVTSKTEGGKVEKSDVPYQANIAGVYSTKPGILGTLAKDPTNYKIEEENDIPVGIMGRVPTKVSTENGPIEPGDYITTSSKPGVGMKATNPGKIVGVALESYNDSGVGKIMVFLNETYYFGEEGTNLVSRISNLEAFMQGGGGSGGFANLLESIGIMVKEGVAYIKNVVIEKLTIGSSEKPTGITLFDEETGEPYCLVIKSGKVKTTAGECRIADDTPPPVIDSGGGGGSDIPPPDTVEIPPPTDDGTQGDGTDDSGDGTGDDGSGGGGVQDDNGGDSDGSGGDSQDDDVGDSDGQNENGGGAGGDEGSGQSDDGDSSGDSSGDDGDGSQGASNDSGDSEGSEDSIGSDNSGDSGSGSDESSGDSGESGNE